MRRDIRSKKRSTVVLAVEQLEDRSLPNALFQLLEDSLLGPAFLLRDKGTIGLLPAATPELLADQGTQILPVINVSALDHVHNALPPTPQPGGGSVENTPSAEDAHVWNTVSPASTLLSVGLNTNFLSLMNDQSPGVSGIGAAGGSASGGPSAAGNAASPNVGSGGAGAGMGLGVAAGAAIGTSNTGATVNAASGGGTSNSGIQGNSIPALSTATSSAVGAKTNGHAPGNATVTIHKQSPGHGPKATAGGVMAFDDPAPQSTLTAPADIPVNGADYNGSPITNGIPTNYDIQVTNWYPNPDPLLQAGSLALPDGTATGGSLNFNIYVNETHGYGNIFLWADPYKSVPVSAGPPVSFILANGFYIEGETSSGAIGDIQLEADYTDPNGNVIPSNTVTMSVTPVLPQGQAITGQAGDGSGGVTVFVTDGGTTVQTNNPATGVPGIKLTGTSIDSNNITGVLSFVQNIIGLQNGFNGGGPGLQVSTTDPDHVNQNYVLRDGADLPRHGFPVLDAWPGSGSIEYPPFLTTAQTPTSIVVNDSPAFYAYPTAISMDVRLTFITYLMWRFTMPSGIYEYYPLAHYTWYANFYVMNTDYAETGDPASPGPLTTPQIGNAVVLPTYSLADDSLPNTDLTRIYNALIVTEDA